ncbi:thioredoxin family protein [Candidatus Gracilibacteria bacterium]|nr:thioredoxin family protein [Candidatus Gracilibacteria bacterium]
MYKILRVSILSMFVLSACTSGQTSTTHSSTDPETVVVETIESTETPSVQLASAQFIDYDKETFKEYEGQKPVALFFHADWCPSCRAVENDINKNLSTLPDGVTIIKINFDTELVLRQKYGVAIQSTIVILDADGEITERLASPSSREIVAAINKNL